MYNHATKVSGNTTVCGSIIGLFAQGLVYSTFGYNFMHKNDWVMEKKKRNCIPHGVNKFTFRNIAESKHRSWVCMDLLHKDKFGVRLHLDALHDSRREKGDRG